jgi:hypothetical protein
MTTPFFTIFDKWLIIFFEIIEISTCESRAKEEIHRRAGETRRFVHKRKRGAAEEGGQLEEPKHVRLL